MSRKEGERESTRNQREKERERAIQGRENQFVYTKNSQTTGMVERDGGGENGRRQKRRGDEYDLISPRLDGALRRTGFLSIV